MREPFFGPNARPFFIQLAFGTAFAHILYALGLWHLLYDLTGLLFD